MGTLNIFQHDGASHALSTLVRVKTAFYCVHRVTVSTSNVWIYAIFQAPGYKSLVELTSSSIETPSSCAPQQQNSYACT